MANDLLLPDGLAPSNLRLKSSVKTRYVEGDVYDICGRLAQISPRLYIVELSEGDGAIWAIMESCDDGVQRLVFKTDALDARILDRCARMLAIPFAQRLRVQEAEIERENAAQHEVRLEAMYEKMGQQFWHYLDKCHFIDGRPISYPKVGVAAPGRAR